MKKLLLNVAMLFVSAQAFAEVKEGEYVMLSKWTNVMPAGCDKATILVIKKTDIAGKIVVDAKDLGLGLCLWYVDPDPRSYELTLESSDCIHHYKGEGLDLEVWNDQCVALIAVPYITSRELKQDGSIEVKFSMK